MAKGQFGPVIRRLRGAVEPPEAGFVSDAELLQRFVGRRDAAAFELLVWRHGGLVLNACRRVLGRTPDADDAFQATFLTLIRKAGSIGRGQALAAWLYRVAHRVAVRARQNAARHRRLELRAEPVPRTAPDPAAADLRAVLDEEVQRLPAVFRMPVILCYLEGLTNDEAARRLGCPKGTVVSRLARARLRLRARLTGRGLAPAVIAAALAGPVASEAVPPALVVATVRLAAAGSSAETVPAVVAALAHGELRAMTLTRVKIALAAVLMLTVGGTGVGLFTRAALAEKQPAPPGALPMDPAGKAAEVTDLTGEWVLQSIEVSPAREGQPAKEAYRLRPTGLSVRWWIKDGKISVNRTWTDEGIEGADHALYRSRHLGPVLEGGTALPETGSYRLPEEREPRPIDLKVPQESWAFRGNPRSYLGIYQVKDGRLTLCLSRADATNEADRPTDFAPRPGREEQVLVFAREKPPAGPPPAPPAAPPALSFESAELEQVTDRVGGIYLPPRRLKLLTPAGAARLASFFPGLGEGKQAPTAAGWKAGLTVRFQTAPSSTVRIQTAPPSVAGITRERRVLEVRVNPALTTWTEGQGDWAVKPGLAEFLDELFREPPPERPPEQIAPADAWSAPDNGLRGRLVYRPRSVTEEGGPALRGVYLEVENPTGRGKMVRADASLLRFELTDAAGRPVERTQLGRYTGAVIAPETAFVPHNGYFGFPLDNFSTVIPREGGTGLALGTHGWLLKPGRYTLRGVFRFTDADKARLRLPEEAWTGQLDLPPLTIEVR
jgi:RNA polymerase sigma factor (sigma-70 family)